MVLRDGKIGVYCRGGYYPPAKIRTKHDGSSYKYAHKLWFIGEFELTNASPCQERGTVEDGGKVVSFVEFRLMLTTPQSLRDSSPDKWSQESTLIPSIQ